MSSGHNLEVTSEQPESGDLQSAAAKLRLLAPFKMRHIDNVLRERGRLLEILKDDEKERFLGPDRLWRMQDFIDTEGRIVEEVLKGVTDGNILTGELWAKMLVEVATRVDIGRRTQIYAELLAARDQRPHSKRIDELLKTLKQSDPDIEERAIDKDYWRQQTLSLQHHLLQDTLSKLF